MSADLQRRFGRFRLPGSWFRDQQFPDILAALDGCIVTRAEALWHADSVEYVAMHPDFAPVPPGGEPPAYRVLVLGGRRTWVPESAA